MLSKIVARFARSAPLNARLPDGRRIYAVGDIHGRLDLLKGIIAQIENDDCAKGEPKGEIIFLGDLVNRGPHSAQVIEYLIALKAKRPNTRFLMGNHEEALLAAMDGKLDALRFFNRHGGKETALSYGVSMESYEAADLSQLSAIIRNAVPTTHHAFLEGLEDVIIERDYIFVHAGVRPGVAIEKQRPNDLRWIRAPFIPLPNEKSKIAIPGKVIIHGHTISPSINESPGRIGLDTGAYLHGVLSAIGLEGNMRWTIQERIP